MTSDSTFPVSFHFLVDFQKLGSHFQVSFTEVSGLNVSFEPKRKLNGMGTHVSVPGELKFEDITVKRPITPLGEKDAFTAWVDKSLVADKGKFIIAYDAIIKLLDDEGAPVAGWKCSCTYPIQWRLSEMKAEESKLAMETVVLACNRIERITKN